MPTATGDESDSSSNGNASDKANAGAGDIDAKINKALSNHMQRLEKKLAAQMSSMFDGDAFGKILENRLEAIANAAVGDAGDPKAASAPAPNGGIEQNKLSLKTLQEKLDSLTKGIETERQARIRAEQQTIETRTRSEVQAHFARHLGADSPHLRPYVNEYMAQFQYKDGAIVRKVADEYGNESYVPAQQAVEELFKAELKHLQPSKTTQLPPNGYRNGAFAQPVGQPGQVRQPQQQTQVNPILGEIAMSIQDVRPEAAQILVSDSAKLSVPRNGSNQ